MSLKQKKGDGIKSSPNYFYYDMFVFSPKLSQNTFLNVYIFLQYIYAHKPIFYLRLPDVLYNDSNFFTKISSFAIRFLMNFLFFVTQHICLKYYITKQIYKIKLETANKTASNSSMFLLKVRHRIFNTCLK